MSKKRKNADGEEGTETYDLPAKHMNASHIKSNERRLVVILEGAQLETVKVSMVPGKFKEEEFLTFGYFEIKGQSGV